MRLLLATFGMLIATAALADYYTPPPGGGSGPPPGGDALLLVNAVDNLLNVGGSNICLAATGSC